MDKKEKRVLSGLKKRFYKGIGRRLESLRKKVSIGKNEIAKGIGVTNSEYSNIESGRSKLTFQQIILLSKMFNLSPSDLFKGLDSDKK